MAVVDGPTATDVDVLSGVESLLDQSPIHQTEIGRRDDGEPRFDMLETVREFGLERLEASGLAKAARDRHAEYFQRFAEAVEPELSGRRQREGVALLEAELANLRAAWCGLASGNAPSRPSGSRER